MPTYYNLAISLSIISIIVLGCSKSKNTDPIPVENIKKLATDFFPVGFYTEGFSSLTRHKQIIDDLTSGGFNVMYSESNALSNSEYEDLLTYSNFKGMHNIIGLQPKGRNDIFINQIKKHNAVVGWAIGDDANILYTKNELALNNASAKAADANHLTFSAVTTSIFNETSKLNDFTSITDVAAIEWYPIYSSATNGNFTYNVMSKFNDATALNSKHSWAILQTYKWPGSGNNWPSPDQITNMTYTSLNAGITGILYYTLRDYRAAYDDRSINISQTDIWATAKRIAAEINGTNGLKDVLQKGELTKLTGTDSVSSNMVSCSYWIYSGFTYLIVTSINENVNSYVKITLPTAATGSIYSLFLYPTTLKKSGNILSGTVNAKSVQIFKIKNN
jgi:hypothetical protein